MSDRTSKHVTNFAGDCASTCPACSEVVKAQQRLRAALSLVGECLSRGYWKIGTELTQRANAAIIEALSGDSPSPVETTPSMDVDTRGRRVQMNEECPDGHHDRGEYFCRRCGRSVVQLASPIQTPAPLNPGQCPNCNHLAKRNEELQKRIHNQRQEIGALLKGGSPESTARKATYRDIYPDDPTWLKEGMTGPWFELPSRLPVEPECQHDLLKPNTTIEVIDPWKAKCKVCIEFFDLRPENGTAEDSK